MPNDMDRAYSAWTGRKAAALKRTTLDCGHQQIDEVHFHLWCDRLSCSTECADAPHDCEQFKGRSGIEEEAVGVGAACICPRDPDDDVDPGDPISTCTVHGWLPAEPEAVTEQPAEALLGPAWARCPSVTLASAERQHPTLAEMNEASAAVRARREVRGRVESDGPIHPGPGTFLPLGEVYLRPGAEPQAYWPDPSVTFAVDISADGSGAVAVRDSDGHIHLIDSAPPVDEHRCGNCGAIDPATCVFNRAGPADELEAWQTARPGDTPGELVPGEADTPQPIDAVEPEEPNPAVPYATGGIVKTSGWVIVGEQGCDLPPPVPWWLRMLGGAR